MEGKGPEAWAYWDRLQEVVATCGPYSIVANKSRLEFMVRVRFAGMDAVSERGMIDLWSNLLCPFDSSGLGGGSVFPKRR